MNCTQMNFIAIHKLDAVFWHLLFINPGTARRTFIKKAEMRAFQMQRGVNP